MKPLVFNFYYLKDLIGIDGKTLDYGKAAHIEPIISLKAKTESVLQMPINHMGFLISRYYPEIEGKILDVDLRFEGKKAEPDFPVLIASYHGKEVAKRVVKLQTLDMEPFISVLLHRKPEVKDAEVVFTVSQQIDEGDET